MPTSLLQPRPLAAAVADFGSRTPVGTALSSAELSRLPVAIRQRAVFSAHVQDARLLSEIRRLILKALELKQEDGVTLDRTQFRLRIRELSEQLGLRPTETDGDRGTIRDIGSLRRLNLIFDHNTKAARGYSAWQASASSRRLYTRPAQEFLRVSPRNEHRPWPQTWADARQSLGGSTRAIVDDQGRMIAPVHDPIWEEINHFGVPWAPFHFNSGMGLRPIRRIEAERLGVVDFEETPEAANPREFNDGHATSLRGIDASLVDALEQQFGGEVVVDREEGTIKWQ